jgi:hypothetical protein
LKREWESRTTLTFALLGRSPEGKALPCLLKLSSFFPGKFDFLKDLTLPSEMNEN